MSAVEAWRQVCLRLELTLANRVDRAIFKCQACGQCLLFQTAFICPLTCTRELRNGPCRGSNPHHCFIRRAQACTWYLIYTRAERQGTLERLLEVNAPCATPVNPSEVGGSTPHAHRYRHGYGPRLLDRLFNPSRYYTEWEDYHNRQRALPWWQGDSRYHPPTYSEPASRLEKQLRSGKFVISVEVAPPMEPTGVRIARLAEQLEGYVDTFNFTDNPRGIARMGGLACAIHSLANGIEPVLQIQTRYRDRYNLESEAVGAHTTGVHNLLCMCDDTGRLGPGPPPTPGPADLDTVQALWMLRRLRDEGVNVDGLQVEHRPRYFLGALVSPCATLPRYAALVTQKKINAGAQFLQTLPIFDLSRFCDWMEALDKRDLLGKAYLIVAVEPPKNAHHLRFLASEVPGVVVPSGLHARMAYSSDPYEEGVQIALEIIAGLKKLRWIHGLHIHAPGREEVTVRLVRESGLRDFAPQVESEPGNGRNRTGADPMPHWTTHELSTHF
ncbi:MAG: methylenetetrahydrofolate reductase C-terminal domain-containing protein [Anaerolineae bacterium]|nr:methylenetetrahydrofolate reductase C-terminal domain-containing protein [Anaerolineae bacterium]